MHAFHYTNYNSYNEAIVGFTCYCRDHNLQVGLSHSQEALQAANSGFFFDYTTLKYALGGLFCNTPEEKEVFESCFETFWGKRKHTYNHKIQNQAKTNVSKKQKASLVMMGFNNSEKKVEQTEDAKNVSGASKLESLKKTDFSKITQIQGKELDEIADQLLQQLNHRLKRKLRSTKKGKIDLRKTIRKNLSNGAEMIHLARKDRKLEKYRLVLILDVSGSMDKYSFYLLKFIWSIKSNLKNIEAFIFSTKLVRITDFLKFDQLEESLFHLSHGTDNWSSGTKIGECMKDFNDLYAKRILNGKSITIVLSDGLDHGEADVLSAEMQKIKLRTSKLVWLNPLKGTRGYEPTAKGMSAALPNLDEFHSAHNFESLMNLENILAHV